MKQSASEKIVTRKALLDIASEWRKNGRTIVFTNGVFDILHRGHLVSFEKAAQFGDKLVVGVNDQNSARQLEKGRGRPINGQDDRALMIAGLAVVDLVILFGEPTPLELIKALTPDVLVKGSDYLLEEIAGREFACRTERIELLEGFSTSNLIERIQSLGKP